MRVIALILSERRCIARLVTEGKTFPDGSLIVGRPARVLRALSAEQIEEIDRIATHYVENARRFAAGFVRLS